MADSITRTVSGKLAKHVAADPQDPFSADDWTYVGNGSLAIDGAGNLSFDHGGGPSESFGGIYTAIAARAKAMVQARQTITEGATSTTDTSGYLGLIGSESGGSLSYLAKALQWGNASGQLRFMNRVINGGGSGAVTAASAALAYGTFVRQSIFCDVTPGAEADRIMQGWDGLNDVIMDGQPDINVSLTSGQPVAAHFENSDAGFTKVSHFGYHADRYVTVADVESGAKAKILGAADAVLVEETGAGGVISLDCLDVWMLEAVALSVTTGGDVELARITPADGLWGGDAFKFVPDAPATYLATAEW